MTHHTAPAEAGMGEYDASKPNGGLGHTANCPQFETRYPWQCDCQPKPAPTPAETVAGRLRERLLECETTSRLITRGQYINRDGPEAADLIDRLTRERDEARSAAARCISIHGPADELGSGNSKGATDGVDLVGFGCGDLEAQSGGEALHAADENAETCPLSTALSRAQAAEGEVERLRADHAENFAGKVVLSPEAFAQLQGRIGELEKDRASAFQQLMAARALMEESGRWKNEAGYTTDAALWITEAIDTLSTGVVGDE